MNVSKQYLPKMLYFLNLLCVKIFSNEGVADYNIIEACTVSTLFNANTAEAISTRHLPYTEHILNTIVVIPIRHIPKFLCNNKMRGIRLNNTSVFLTSLWHLSVALVHITDLLT